MNTAVIIFCSILGLNLPPQASHRSRAPSEISIPRNSQFGESNGFGDNNGFGGNCGFGGNDAGDTVRSFLALKNA